MIVVVLASFGFLVWNAYRQARMREGRGEGFRPAGKRRWDGRGRP